MLSTALLQRQQGAIGVDHPACQNIIEAATCILQQNQMYHPINPAHLIRHLAMFAVI